MTLFENNHGNLKQIKEISFDKEKNIQKITEKNLDKIFNLEFVKSEFSIAHSRRIDTLAFDQETSSFTIIEYKKGTDKGLFEQGLAYWEIMLNRPADFITEYNENLNKNLKKRDVDWTQSRIIFVSPSFSKNQKQAANLDLHIELWQINSYQNNLLEYSLIQTSETKTPMKLLGAKEGVFKKITEEIITYDEDYHFQTHGSDKTKELYYDIKNKIILLGDSMELICKKKYIAFKTNYNFVYINLTRKVIHIDLALKIHEVQDPKKILRNMDKIGHYGSGHTRITISDKSQLPYMIGLIEQAYVKSIKNE